MSIDQENELYDKKWIIGYALRKGGKCKDTKCMYETEEIAKGEIKIGRRFPSAFREGEIQVNWFHAKCMFSQQTRARQTTQVIEHESDMDGFGDLLLAEQQYIRQLIQGNIDLRFDGQKLPNAKSAPSVKRQSEPGTGRRLSSSTPAKDEKKAKTPKTPGSGSRRDFGRILML
jgi:hypothetical protein